AGLRNAGATHGVDADSAGARTAGAAVGGGRAGLAAAPAGRAGGAVASPAGAALVDPVTAGAATLIAGGAVLRRAADLDDQVVPAVLPDQASGVAQRDLIAEPEPAALRAAVVRTLLAEAAAPDEHVHLVLGDGGRDLERARRRRAAARTEDRLGDAAAA